MAISKECKPFLADKSDISKKGVAIILNKSKPEVPTGQKLIFWYSYVLIKNPACPQRGLSGAGDSLT